MALIFGGEFFVNVSEGIEAVDGGEAVEGESFGIISAATKIVSDSLKAKDGPVTTNKTA